MPTAPAMIIFQTQRRTRCSYDFLGAVGAPSEPLTVLDSAEPAAICFTSGLRHTFLATADLLRAYRPL